MGLCAALCSQLRLLLDAPDLELAAVLGQDVLAVVLPERLGRILTGVAFQDLCAAGVLVGEVCEGLG